MAKHNKQARGRRNKPAHSARKRWLSIGTVFKLGLITVFIFTAYVLWLDYRIYREFEGSKWTVPARVYSRPTDIFTGQTITGPSFEQLLRRNNYEYSATVNGPGQYARNGNRIDVYIRAFDYWDGHVQSRPYRLLFQNGAISRIQDLSLESDVALIRIEPVLIGKIYPDHSEDRILLGLDEVPQFLINALIAVEDRSFFQHFGIDLRGIARAFWVNLRRGELSQGGSTLTQQLVKNFFLSSERTLGRKLNEIIMALLLEWRYEKDEILAAYLNEVYVGQYGARAIHGFGTAAEFYFNKPLYELREDQLALLAGMVRGASYYNPRRSPVRAVERRNLVLSQMQEQGKLDTGLYKKLVQRSLDVTVDAQTSSTRFTGFLDLAKRQLLQDYRVEDLKNEGLRIYTTLDTAYQTRMDMAVERQLHELEQARSLELNSLEAAALLVNPVNGEILAVNGGRNMATSGFNRALDAVRPVGSLIKPFIYLTALSIPQQYSLLTAVDDSRISLPQEDGDAWTPDNYDHTEHGTVSLLEAMVNSYNLATVNLGLKVGVENVISTLQHSGLQQSIQAYPSLLLGAIDLTPFQVAQIYQTLANGGYRVELNSIQEVLNNAGEPLQRRSLRIEEGLDDRAVYLTNYLMSQVVAMGTAQTLVQSFGNEFTLAGKTGTTNESRDSWFAGYGDNLLAVTWLGRDDNQPTPFTGSSGAMRIWADIMAGLPLAPLQLVEPVGIAVTDDIEISFEGECYPIGEIPYVETAAPDDTLICSQGGNALESFFNIRNWFQR